MRLSRPLKACLATVLSLLVVAAGTRPAAPADETLVVPVVLSLTGPFAFLGKQEADTLHILENATNAAGGIKGQHVRFDIQDDTSNVQVSVQLANALIAKGAPAILGFNSTAACSAVVPLARNGPVLYCVTPGVNGTQGSYLFSSGVGSVDIFLAMVHFLRDRGLHRIATLWSIDASGQEAEREVNAALARPENASVQNVINEHFNTTDLSVAAQMTRIANSGAQACICFASGTPFGTILRGYTGAGLTIPLASSTGNMVYSQMQQYQSMGIEQLYVVGFLYDARGRLPRGAVRDQVEAFYNAFRGTNYRPDAGSGAIWDAARILMTALHDLGPSATAPQVRDYIERLRGFAGIDGTYDFTQTPHRGISYPSAVVTRWDPVNNAWIAMTTGGR